MANKNETPDQYITRITAQYGYADCILTISMHRQETRLQGEAARTPGGEERERGKSHISLQFSSTNICSEVDDALGAPQRELSADEVCSKVFSPHLFCFS